MLLLAVGVPSAARAAELPRLEVSEIRRLLITSDDKLFIYLGDTAWELFHTVKLDCIKGDPVRAWWYSPRNGQAMEIGEFANPKAEKEFVPPDPGENLDWVLVLDNASKNFGVPGK